MFNEIAQSIFKMQNFFDELTIVDKNGIIQYCKIIVPDIYSFTADEVIGKHTFEIFPSSNEDNSHVYQVLKTGKAICSFEDDCVTYKGDITKNYSAIHPIFKKGELIGAAIAVKFLDSNVSKEFFQVLGDNKSTKSRGIKNYTLDDLITQDPHMIDVKKRIKKASKHDSSVLIQGKTGTGKEIVAQALHFSSDRAEKPFISQNCSAIPANLLESTLFGTEKGSFTGAVSSKGLFELANGGTLFLDEINSLDISLQSKLLKAIEEKYIRRIGGHENIRLDVRIIAAINEDPFNAIADNRLRQDLFYRLNVVSLLLNELKERKNDVQLLTKFFIDYYNKSMNKHILGLRPDVEAAFSKHTWPGNVRELRNVIEGAFNLAEGEYITLADIQDHLVNTSPKLKHISPIREILSNADNTSYDSLVESFEKEVLLHAMETCRTKTEAAKMLHMSRQAFNYKLDRFNLK